MGPLVDAREELVREGKAPPRIGMFYDTTTLYHADLTTPGGKDERATAPGLLLEPRAAEEAEALPPLADDLAGGIQAGRDDIIPQPLGRQEDDLGPEDVSIR